MVLGPRTLGLLTPAQALIARQIWGAKPPLFSPQKTPDPTLPQAATSNCHRSCCGGICIWHLGSWAGSRGTDGYSPQSQPLISTVGAQLSSVSAGVLVGAAWVWLRCCFRRSGSVPWTLVYRRGWMNYAIFSAFSMGNCFEANPSAISVKCARCSSAVSAALCTAGRQHTALGVCQSPNRRAL